MLHLHLHHSDTSSAAIADDLADALVTAADRHAVTDERSLVVEALAAVYVHRPRRPEDLMRHLTAAEPQWGPDLHRALWEHRDVAGQLVTARTLADEPAADPVGSWLRLWVSEVANGQRPLDQSPPPPAAIGTGDDRAQFELTLWRITVSIATGRLARARHRIDQALAAPGHHDAAETARRTTGLYGQRAYLAVICNDVEDARYWSSQAAMPTWTNHHPIMRYVAAYMLARSGERRRADEMCDDLLIEMTDSAVPHSDRLVRLTLLTDVCLAAGHTDGLGQCLAALEEHRGQHAIFHFAQYWGAADCAIGKAQVGLGDLDAGIDSLSEALDQHQRMHAVVQERHNRYELARALAVRARPGDTRSAEEHRRRVCQIEQSCGLPSLDVAASAVAPAWSITAGRAR